MNNMGEMILDHYQKYLGEFIGAEPYSDNEHQIQLLGFDKAIENSLLFATLGLSKYSESINNCCEVIMAAVYFTESYVFPENFSIIEGKCKVYMGFLVSQNEVDYVKKYGCEQFEEILEEKDVDVINIDRRSVI